MAGFTYTAAVFVCVLPIAVLAVHVEYPECVLNEGPTPENKTVSADITSCANGTVFFKLSQNWTLPWDRPDEVLTIDLYYDCTNAAGNNTVEQIPRPTELGRWTFREEYNVSIKESFQPVSCTLIGCYTHDSYDSTFSVINETVTCNFSEVLTPSNTIAPLTASDTTTTVQRTTLLATASTAVQMTTLPTTTTTINTPSIPPTTDKFPDDPDNMTRTVVVSFAIFLCLAGVTILVLVGILLKFRQVQRRQSRKKQCYYYNDNEPIDQYYVPVDASAQIKAVFSFESLFESYDPQPDTSDDERSEVLQGTILTEDNSSMKSLTSQNGSGVRLVTKDPAPSEKPSETEAASVKDSSVKESTASDSSTAPRGLFSPVPNGYVVQRAFSPSIVTLRSPTREPHQEQHGNTSPMHWNQTAQKQFRTKLDNSGYITDLDAVSRIRTMSPNSRSGVQEKSYPQHKYTTLGNGYTIDLSQPNMSSTPIVEEDLYAVYCNGDLEDDGGDRLFFEMVAEECNFVLAGETLHEPALTAECSLSLNPRHFEPMNYDELMKQDTSPPPYVNTATSPSPYVNTATSPSPYVNTASDY